QVDRLFPDSDEKLKVSEVIRRIIDVLVSGLIQNTKRSLAEQDIHDVEQVRELSARIVGFDEETGKLNLELKRFLHRYLYRHEVLESARENAQQRLEDLFDFYMNEPRLLPGSHVDRITELGLHRVVCDYIAGMTDSYAAFRHDEIRGGVGLTWEASRE
ncbi:MAG: hypothetical protein JSU96_07010, partial [Acidobacteriota bacterium]